jgi:predicted nucleic acid-binding protein
MKAVVDTNVVAYYLLGTAEFADEARRFWHAVTEPLAPALWEAELANVVWMSVRTGVLPGAEGPAKLSSAARLGIHSVATRTLWHGALLRAVQTGVAVYDTLFVELADRERVPLVTFDQRLLRTWPKVAKRPADLPAQ